MNNNDKYKTDLNDFNNALVKYNQQESNEVAIEKLLMFIKEYGFKQKVLDYDFTINKELKNVELNVLDVLLTSGNLLYELNFDFKNLKIIEIYNNLKLTYFLDETLPYLLKNINKLKLYTDIKNYYIEMVKYIFSLKIDFNLNQYINKNDLFCPRYFNYFEVCKNVQILQKIEEIGFNESLMTILNNNPKDSLIVYVRNNLNNKDYYNHLKDKYNKLIIKDIINSNSNLKDWFEILFSKKEDYPFLPKVVDFTSNLNKKEKELFLKAYFEVFNEKRDVQYSEIISYKIYDFLTLLNNKSCFSDINMVNNLYFYLDSYLFNINQRENIENFITDYIENIFNDIENLNENKDYFIENLLLIVLSQKKYLPLLSGFKQINMDINQKIKKENIVNNVLLKSGQINISFNEETTYIEIILQMILHYYINGYFDRKYNPIMYSHVQINRMKNDKSITAKKNLHLSHYIKTAFSLSFNNFNKSLLMKNVLYVLNNLLEKDSNKNDNYLPTLFDCIVTHFETDNFRDNSLELKKIINKITINKFQEIILEIKLNNEKNNELNEYSFKNNNINILESVVNDI